MCGITGIVKKNKNVTMQEIIPMTEAISHRGPDGFGYYVNNNYAIGHRRLSIIDPKNGMQPFHSDDNKYHLTYNGEIYNYIELKEELREMGYKFKTTSDTEVLLMSYIEWGKDCVKKLRGMFAFAIVDEEAQIIFLARDHFGIKPLSIYSDNEKVAFSSEIQAFRLLDGFVKEIDIQAIDRFLAFQYVPAPYSIYKNVQKLLPGHFIVIGFDGSISEQKSYYELTYATKQEKLMITSEEETIKLLDNTIRNSVEKHLISDVEYGAFLSGGIDSTLVVDYMTQILDKPINTFSIGFENDDYSELEYARVASKINRTNHHEQIISGNALEVLPEIVSYYGEPFGDSSAIPTYYVSKLASEHVKMVLSGDGADEMFAGYGRYQCLDGWKGKEHIRRQLKLHVNKVVDKDPNERWNNKYDDHFNQLCSLVIYYTNDERKKLWKKEFLEYNDSTLDDYYSQYRESVFADKIKIAQSQDMLFYLPYDILTKIDIAGMMCSIETRTPFVDRIVYEASKNIPTSFNFNLCSDKGYQGKLLLKKIMSKKYDEKFLFRKKRGFSMPLNKWFTDENNYAYHKKMRLCSESAKINSFFNKEVIAQIVNSNNSGKIWLLLVLEEWLEQNL